MFFFIKLLRSVFLEEWAVLFNLKAAASTELKIKSDYIPTQIIRGHAYAETHALASLGGNIFINASFEVKRHI